MTTDILDFPHVILARIGRIEKMGGELISETATNGEYVAAICKNADVHFVIYADDTFDRFEKEELVKYRPGYTGPVINDDAMIERVRNENLRKALQDAADEKAAKKLARAEAKAGVKKSKEDLAVEAARAARYTVKVDEKIQPIIDAALPAFDFFFDKFGDGLTRRIGTSVRERENWADPDYILDAVAEKMQSELLRQNGPETTLAAWQSFRNLDKKYQLALAYQFAGVLPLR